MIIIRLLSHMIKRLLSSHSSVCDRNRVIVIVRLLSHCIHVVKSHFSGCDRRQCGYSSSATQPYDQEATFQPFQWVRQETV